MYKIGRISVEMQFILIGCANFVKNIVKSLCTSILPAGGSQDLKDLSAQEQSLLAGSHWGSLGGKSGYWRKDGKKINNIGERGRNRRKRNVLTLHCLNRRDLQRAENTTIGCFFLIFKQDKCIYRKIKF